MQYILHIDTSGSTGLVALAGDGKSLYQKINTDSRNHAAMINPMIEAVLQEAGIAPADLDAIAVVGGPGSYTGLRIGLAAAKGLCYALDLPLILHNKLSLLASQLREQAQADYYGALLPAREGEYFFALFDRGGETMIEPGHFPEQDLAATGGKPDAVYAVTGLSKKAISHIFNRKHIIYVENEEIALDHWTETAFRDMNCNSFVNLSTAEPFYLKQVYTHKPKEIR